MDALASPEVQSYRSCREVAPFLSAVAFAAPVCLEIKMGITQIQNLI